MNPGFDAFLVRLYTDDELRRAFLVDPRTVARAAGLSEAEAAALEGIDRPGLELAARSFAAKRQGAPGRQGLAGRWRWRPFHGPPSVVF